MKKYKSISYFELSNLFWTYRGAVFLHWMGHLVAFVATSFPGEETVLAHVEVETLETAISETDSSQ